MKDIKIKAIAPQFTTMITTLDVYEEDLIVDGMLAAPKGTLKLYQRVLCTGPLVKEIKPGDLVLLNFQNYKQLKYKNGSIKNDIEEMEQEVTYDIPRIIINDKLCGKFQDRDVEGVITEYEEYETEKASGTLR